MESIMMTAKLIMGMGLELHGSIITVSWLTKPGCIRELEHLVCFWLSSSSKRLVIFNTRLQFIATSSSSVADFCMWGPCPFGGWDLLSYFNQQYLCTSSNAHDISLMLIVSRHGGLKLSFYMAYLECSSVESSKIILVVYFQIFYARLTRLNFIKSEVPLS